MPILLAIELATDIVWQHLATSKHTVSVAKPLPRGRRWQGKTLLTGR
jgi:hypothetical protein